MDFAEARRNMVNGQVKPNGVTDPRIFQAMQDIPRERFAPPALASRALADEDLALGGGRVLLQPMTIAKLIQLALPRPGERALVVASGTGYGAAILASVGVSVVAVEGDEALLAVAGPALASSGLPTGSLRQIAGDPAAAPEGGPYDLILIEGAVPSIPPTLSGALAEGGRLVGIRVLAGRSGAAVIGRRIAGSFSVVEAFDASAPILPAFAPKPGFVFA
ncbi:protein-L-isoaspartate O-methyltransferase family protein [Muricoccus radiodurans]|uniref:protein-L-isoaspartate O-methyltransferase family protein n=1 Tax=Muricoccus radiodurans TaxID=2231721 RepID=UPI003CEF4DFB